MAIPTSKKTINLTSLRDQEIFSMFEKIESNFENTKDRNPNFFMRPLIREFIEEMGLALKPAALKFFNASFQHTKTYKTYESLIWDLRVISKDSYLIDVYYDLSPIEQEAIIAYAKVAADNNSSLSAYLFVMKLHGSFIHPFSHFDYSARLEVIDPHPDHFEETSEPFEKIATALIKKKYSDVLNIATTVFTILRSAYGEVVIYEVFKESKQSSVNIDLYQLCEISKDWENLKEFPLDWTIQTI
jgi:hypothetical protein